MMRSVSMIGSVVALLLAGACGGSGGGDDDTGGDDDPIPGETDEDGDGVKADLDCDDTDPNVYPGAPEVCDGKVNACGGTSREDGMVTFFPMGGKARDVTAMAGGTQGGSPVTLDLGAESGALRMCAGTFHVSLRSSAASLAVRGAGTTRTVLSGGGMAPVLTASAPNTTLELEDLTLRDGAAATGAALEGRGTLKVARVSFTDNTATGASPEGWGGAVLWTGTATISGSSFSNNTSTTAGGALGVQGSLTLRDSTFTKNTSGSGGGVAVLDGTVLIEGVDLTENRATQNGAGLFLQNATSTLRDVTALDGSSSSGGGGITLLDGTATIEDSLLKDNFASLGGGGITIGKTNATLKRVRVEANDSLRFINQSPSLFSGFGAGIQVSNAKVRIEDCQLIGNRGRWGWGLFVQRSENTATLDVDVVNTAFTGNANIVGDNGSAALEHWSTTGMASFPVSGILNAHCDNNTCASTLR